MSLDITYALGRSVNFFFEILFALTQKVMEWSRGLKCQNVQKYGIFHISGIFFKFPIFSSRLRRKSWKTNNGHETRLPALGRACDRMDVSNRAAASLASARPILWTGIR